MHFDELDQTLNTEVGERQDTVFALASVVGRMEVILTDPNA